MRDRKWTDCPVCGAKGSMKRRKGRQERFHPKGYAPLDIDGLSGQFCEVCGDGFWSFESESKIARLVGMHMAKGEAGRNAGRTR